MKEYFVIYHAHCSDGFGSAWAIWRLLGESATYYAALHGTPPPSGLEGKHVIIADFAYSRETLIKINSIAKSLIVLDHHKSAQEDLQDLPFTVFDMTRSGAGISWDYFHKVARPPLIDYIEDRDLWKWSLPNSREILTTFECVKASFDNFDAFNAKLESKSGRDLIIEQGVAIQAYKNAKIESLVAKAYTVDLTTICSLDDLTMQVPCINTPLFHSEVGSLLAQKHPLVIIWHRAEDGVYRHSLRSDGKIDCSKIARFWGGGGHANAAGFTTPEPLPALIRSESEG